MPAVGSDGTIYVGSDNGKLYAIYSDSRGLAQSSWPMFHHDVQHTGRVPREEGVVIPLTLEEPYNGVLWPWQFNDFSLEAEANRSLLIEVVPGEGTGSMIVDGLTARCCG